MRVAILQSNYLPWRGYFDVIHDVDIFVFYDDVQYTLRDWRNRNKIKTAQGACWITIPTGNQRDRRICDVEITDHSWQQKHWRAIDLSYRRAPHFEWCVDLLRDFYAKEWTSLSDLNQTLITRICRELLGIQTELRDSCEFAAEGTKSDRLLDILLKLGATEYLSGPAAKAYLEEDKFDAAGIKVLWKDYGVYPEYPQPHGAFVPNLSIVDTLMCCGPETPYYIWGHRVEHAAPESGALR